MPELLFLLAVVLRLLCAGWTAQIAAADRTAGRPQVADAAEAC